MNIYFNPMNGQQENKLEGRLVELCNSIFFRATAQEVYGARVKNAQIELETAIAENATEAEIAYYENVRADAQKIYDDFCSKNKKSFPKNDLDKALEIAWKNSMQGTAGRDSRQEALVNWLSWYGYSNRNYSRDFIIDLEYRLSHDAPEKAQRVYKGHGVKLASLNFRLLYSEFIPYFMSAGLIKKAEISPNLLFVWEMKDAERLLKAAKKAAKKAARDAEKAAKNAEKAEKEATKKAAKKAAEIENHNPESLNTLRGKNTVYEITEGAGRKFEIAHMVEFEETMQELFAC